MRKSSIKESVILLMVEFGLPILFVGSALVAGVVLSSVLRQQKPNPFHGWQNYSFHTPWGVENVILPQDGAEALKSGARRDAIAIELSAPGTLDAVCSKWSIEFTVSAVNSICKELKAQAKAEAEAQAKAEAEAKAKAEAEAKANAEAEAQAKAEAKAEEDEVLRRIEELHKAGGPID